jgi:hypothetical protein
VRKGGGGGAGKGGVGGREDARRRGRGRGRGIARRRGGGRRAGGGGWGDSRQRRFFWTTSESPKVHPSCGRRFRATTKKYLKPTVANPATNPGLRPSKAARPFLKGSPRAPPSPRTFAPQDNIFNSRGHNDSHFTLRLGSGGQKKLPSGSAHEKVAHSQTRHKNATEAGQFDQEVAEAKQEGGAGASL